MSVAPRGADRVPVRADLAGAEPYGAPQLDPPVRLNTNETPYPPPPALYEQLARRLGDLALHRYPDRRVQALRAALAARYQRSEGGVWVASGSNEVLQQLLQAYGGPGRRVLLFRPGYSMHPNLAAVTLTEVVEADLDKRLRLSVACAEEAVTAAEPDLVCLANPNNPTGLAVSPEVVRTLHDASGALVIVDEAYAEFAPDGHSALGLLDALPRLVVVRTFSKAWRLAGARLGYLLGPEWVVDDLGKVRLPYHLDALAQEAGLVACELAAEVTAHIPGIVAERDRLFAELEATGGVEVWPSAANFLLFRSGVPDLFDRLLARGVLVRDFSDQPRLAGCLRVTVGTPEENDAFLAALRATLGSDQRVRQEEPM